MTPLLTPAQLAELHPVVSRSLIYAACADGLLAHYLGCYELTEMMRQMEMLPPRGTKVGGAYLLSLTNGGMPTASARSSTQ